MRSWRASLRAANSRDTREAANPATPTQSRFCQRHSTVRATVLILTTNSGKVRNMNHRATPAALRRSFGVITAMADLPLVQTLSTDPLPSRPAGRKMRMSTSSEKANTSS